MKRCIVVTRSFPRKQKGIVLIIVILAIVLMLTLLTSMIEDQHIFIRRLANQKVAEQSFQYSQGLNAWAERVLHEDSNRTIDSLNEKWAKFGRPEPELAEGESESFSLDRSTERALTEEEEKRENATIDFGLDTLEYSIDDLQGRFNLNNIGVKDPQQRQGQKRIFLNLLEILELGEFDERDRLYGALLDWLDENDASNANGFESGDYQSKKTPYFAADQKLTSMGELRYVEGFSAEIIKKLKPYVTILPIEGAKININTTSVEVLASLSSGTVSDTSSAAGFLAKRDQPGFQGFQPNQIEEAKSAIIAVSVASAQPVANMTQVNSQFFQINTKVSLGDYAVCMQSVVLRESATEEAATTPKVSVLSRQHNTLCEDEETSQNTTINNSDEDLR